MNSITWFLYMRMFLSSIFASTISIASLRGDCGRGCSSKIILSISIGRRAPSAAVHWMRRAARLCVASLTLCFVGQRPDTKGAPPLYLTPLPNGPFPWCPPDWYRYQRTPTGHATLGGEIAPALTPPRARMSIMPRPMMRSRTLDIPHHALVQRSRTPP